MMKKTAKEYLRRLSIILENKIEVSVAVITYNMENYIEPLLESILKQKVNFSYEIVIDDDNSPDNTREILLKYKDKFPNIIKLSLRNNNVAGSRNMFGVMNQCRGEYIAILEGDDWWEDENKLQYQYDFLQNNPQYIGMTCNSWCDHGEKPEYSQLMRNRKNTKIFSFKDFQSKEFSERLPSSTDTWMFKNIFKLYPNEDFSVFYKAHKMIWDQSLILILYGKGDIFFNPKVVSHHRSVTKKDGTNYQSMIIQKNCLSGDSQMYFVMEEYIKNNLKKKCGNFVYARANVWIDAKFRALKTKDDKDICIEKEIWKNQSNKLLLIYLLAKKSTNIMLRKLRLIK